MKKLFTLFVALVALSLTVNAQEAKPQDPAKHQARVFPLPIEHLYFYSEILNYDKNFTVYLPKSYTKETDRKYPVVYLLHGANENDWEWANIPGGMINEAITKAVADGMACEMVIVCPNATEGTMGYFNRDNWKYEDYFFNELVPFIESHYRVIADKGHRAIGGLSMGGGGSFTYGITHPDMFSSVYAMSAAVPSTLVKEEGGSPYGKTFSSGLDISSYSPEQLENIKTVHFVLDCGDDDFLFDANAACYQAMKKAGFTCQFRTRNGAHASYYWYESLGEALRWFTRHFSEQCK